MVLNVLTAAAIVLGSGVAQTASRPARTPPTPPPADMIAANAAAERFVQALREARWSNAIALCSEEAQKASASYNSLEAFFRAVVPWERIIQETKFPLYFWNDMGQNWGLKAPALKLAELEPDPTIPWPIHTWTNVHWQWRMKQKDSGWRVEFPTTAALETYVRDKLAELRQRREELVAQEKAMEPSLRNVHTRLTVQDRRIEAGQPIRLRLELINDGPAQLLYDDSAVRWWMLMTVTNARGEIVASPHCTGQIMSACKLLKPGDEALVLDNWDLTANNPRFEPGLYTVRFDGSGLGISETDPNKPQHFERSPRGPVETMPGYGRRSSRSFPSNAAQFEIVATQPAGI